MKKCPFCGAEVNKENLDKHFLKVHGDLDKEDFKREGLKKPVGTAGRKRTQSKGKAGQRKRKPKKKDRVSTAVSVIVLIIIASLVGVLIYQYYGQNGGSNDENTNNGYSGDKPIAVITTTLGTIKIELDTDKAPATAANFIELANSGFYEGIIFHRVIPDFVIQAGGYTSDETRKTADSIPWENTGLLNSKYSISMARSGNASSESDSGTATSQFFINLVDNQESLDSPSYPYVVFGRVIDGFSVVDAIAGLPTNTNDWPDDPPIITNIVIED